MAVIAEKVRALPDVDNVPALRLPDVVHVPALRAGDLASKSVAPLPGFTVRDLFGEEKSSPYVCKGVIEVGDLMVVFGESGAMKSFWALDLLMHIAAGLDYCGHRVSATGVVLIAGEGGKGMKRRLKAWTIRHGITEHTPQPPIFVATQPANLMFDDGTIRATIEHAESKLGVPVGVVCFDTLAASFGPGDENLTGDMNRVLATTRETCPGRAVMLVHHVGHGQKDRERGAYSLRANAEWRVLVERPNDGSIITATSLKAKDGEPFKPMSFEWRQVDTGWTDADGDSVTSVILDPTEYRPIAKGPTGRLQKAVLRQLRAEPLTKAELTRSLTAKEFNRTAIYKAIDALLNAELIVVGIDSKLRPIEVCE